MGARGRCTWTTCTTPDGTCADGGGDVGGGRTAVAVLSFGLSTKGEARSCVSLTGFDKTSLLVGAVSMSISTFFALFLRRVFLCRIAGASSDADSCADWNR